jgi:hypothetical protein
MLAEDRGHSKYFIHVQRDNAVDACARCALAVVQRSQPQNRISHHLPKTCLVGGHTTSEKTGHKAD